MSREAMKLALEALENINSADNDRDFLGPKECCDLDNAITALREALAEQPARPYRQLQDNGSKYFGESWDKVEQPAQQEPVAWMTEERYAEMHTSKWTPKIQQVFSKDGILESQTIQYAPQSKTVPYPPPQRTWVGLTPKELDEMFSKTLKGKKLVNWVARAIESKLKEKNA